MFLLLIGFGSAGAQAAAVALPVIPWLAQRLIADASAFAQAGEFDRADEALTGALDVEGEPLPLTDLVGYHDHNWGFWKGVRWQWGQVAAGDLHLAVKR